VAGDVAEMVRLMRSVLPGAESLLSCGMHRESGSGGRAHQVTLEGLEAWQETGKYRELWVASWLGACWRGVELVSGRILSGSADPGACVCRVGDGMDGPVVVPQ
jgi:hypothetical protein